MTGFQVTCPHHGCRKGFALLKYSGLDRCGCKIKEWCFYAWDPECTGQQVHMNPKVNFDFLDDPPPSETLDAMIQAVARFAACRLRPHHGAFRKAARGAAGRALGHT